MALRLTFDDGHSQTCEPDELVEVLRPPPGLPVHACYVNCEHLEFRDGVVYLPVRHMEIGDPAVKQEEPGYRCLTMKEAA